MAESKSRKSPKTGKSSYKGRAIRVHKPQRIDFAGLYDESDIRTVAVEIDDRSIEIFRMEKEEYESTLIPYRSYKSPLDLVRDIIDYEPSFQRR